MCIVKSNSEEYCMAKLRVYSKEDPMLGYSEWIGTPQELLEIYDGLKQRLGDTLQTQPPQKATIQLPNRMPSDYSEMTEKMPTVKQLITYILEKPRFEHDIVDVGKKFFGKPVKSREYGRLYRQLKARLETARKEIEAIQRGAFERRSTHPRNLKVYTFRRVNAVPLGVQTS